MHRILTGVTALLLVGLPSASPVQAGEPGGRADVERRVAAVLQGLSDTYEALLQGVFGGDFLALLAWSRSAHIGDFRDDRSTRRQELARD